MVEIFIRCHLVFSCMGLAAQDFKFSNWFLMEMPHGGHSSQMLLAGEVDVLSIAPADWFELLSRQRHPVVGIRSVAVVKGVVNGHQSFFHLVATTAPAVVFRQAPCFAIQDPLVVVRCEL